ncbi:MAG: UDP-N-acetylglucosamine 2-epimerase [Candidatus Jettenia ecosi]|uniref:UDP-N-acetylglucosamine 2-epimerase n=1 Tax=Candidatus Jettenia ecosi TaxID=2494326 RepID=A0A533Q5L6_9BACT|nr:MAG: UDP-N-acetylglucosamine 2-epimerase [Candidatus Jettenia ecosi]
MKVTNIVGARPQFIKYSPVSKAIEEFNKQSLVSNNNASNTTFDLYCSKMLIEDILIHTGQHYDYAMSEIFFNELSIKNPHYHLGVGSHLHGIQTGQILQRVEEVLLKEKPDIVIVYGDTNTTLGSALAAVKLHIPVVHIEAGLRSYNKYMPEEINRVLTDHASSLLLCPTENAVENLRKEGFGNTLNNGKLPDNYSRISHFTPHVSHPIIINVGDVMYDVLLATLEIAAKKSKILENLDLIEKEYYILTIHRAENTDNYERLEEIITFVNDISTGNTVIFPSHPRTKKIVGSIGKKFANNIKVIEPVGYFDMVWLLKNSVLALTDSGGLQKEAYWLKIPCITLRDETEWIETVQSGWNILYKDYKEGHSRKYDNNYYGDGKSAEKIVNILAEWIDNQVKENKRTTATHNTRQFNQKEIRLT